MYQIKSSFYVKYILLGATPKHGHFVCHVLNGENFVCFNDSHQLKVSTHADLQDSLLFLYKKSE